MYPNLSRRGLQNIFLYVQGMPGSAQQEETLVALSRALSSCLHTGWATSKQKGVQEIEMLPQ